MPPPKLTGDAPVADIAHPVIIGLRVSFGNEFDSSILNRLERGLCEAVDGNEPLLGNHGFYHGVAAVAGADIMGVRLDLDERSAFLERLNELHTALRCGEAGKSSAKLVDMTIGGKYAHSGEPCALTDFKIVGVVARGYLNCAGAEINFDIFIGNDGDFPADDGHDNGLAH